MAFDIGKAEGTVNLLIILAIMGIVAYALYSLFNGDGPLSSDCSKAPDNCDPATGQYIGPLNAAMNWLWPEKFPGGGEVVGSSETYTGALTESVEHPIDTFESIFGFSGASGAAQLPTSGGTPLSSQTQQLTNSIAAGANY